MLFIEGTEIIVLRGEEGIIGFMIIRLIKDQAEIITVAIDRKERNKGFGKFLLRKSIENIKDKGGAIIFLEVAESDEAALNLYKSSGFEVIGKRNNYYTRAEKMVDAINMRLVL